MKAAGWLLDRPERLGIAQKAASASGKVLGRNGMIGHLPGPGPVAGWFGSRDLKAPPAETFRSWWARTGGQDDDLQDGAR